MLYFWMVVISEQLACGEIANDADGIASVAFRSRSASSAGGTSPRAANSASRVRVSGRPADAGPIHWPDIPAQMQHQIADRVLVVGVARPDLFARQTPEAILDAAAQLVAACRPKISETLARSQDLLDQFSRIDFTLPVN